MTAFQLDVRQGTNGKPKLHFNHIFTSDWHLGTEECKAGTILRMLNNVATDHITLVGDVIDFWYARKHGHLNITEKQQQIVETLMRSDAEITYLPGNHDEIFRHTGWLDQQFFNIKFEDHIIHTSERGQRFLVCHGDIFDDKLRQENGMGLYHLGDWSVDTLNAIDAAINRTLGLEEFSTVGQLSQSFAEVSEKHSHMKSNLLDVIRAHNFRHPDQRLDGVICGHSHIPIIEKTTDGLTLINDGSSTGNSMQFFAEDQNGTKAILTWKKDKLKIKDEHGNSRSWTWKELGLGHFTEKPKPIADEYSRRATLFIRQAQNLLAQHPDKVQPHYGGQHTHGRHTKADSGPQDQLHL